MYDKLGDGQIRLLRLAPGCDLEPIVLHLETFNIVPKSGIWGWLTSFWIHYYYEALSYQWGSPEKTRSIICQGTRIEVHQNLHDALLVLRRLRPNSPLWIDSICINQEDEAEKRSQIAMMAKIYSTARRVWAFLGKPPDGMQELMCVLPEITKLCRHVWRYTREVLSTNTSIIDQPAARTVPENFLRSHSTQLECLAPPYSPVWRALKCIVTGNYFNRLWILQEVALGKQITFLCGGNILTYEQVHSLLRATWLLQPRPGGQAFRKVNAACFDIREELLCSGWSDWLCARFIRLFLKHSSDSIDCLEVEDAVGLGGWLSGPLRDLHANSLGRILRFSRTQKCSRPEDRILAISAMVEVVLQARQLPWLGTSMSAPEVYLETFYFVSRYDTTLSILRLAPPSTTGLALPSWCPDFDRPRASRRRSDGFSDMYQMPSSRGWQASKLSQKLVRRHDPQVLIVQGIRIDEIEMIMPRWTSLNLHNLERLPDKLIENISKAADWVRSAHATVLSKSNGAVTAQMREDLYRTLSLQDPALTLTLVDNPSSICEFDTLFELLDLIVNYESMSLEVRNQWYVDNPIRNISTPHSPLWILDRIDDNMRDKVLFFTKSGRVGLSFHDVHIGDVLVVLRGAAVPHILRRSTSQSKTWNFVSEAYVRGIMHGEAEEPEGSGAELMPETFVLV